MREVVEKRNQQSEPLRPWLSLPSTGRTDMVRVGTVVRAVETVWVMEGAHAVSGAGEGGHRVVAGGRQLMSEKMGDGEEQSHTHPISCTHSGSPTTEKKCKEKQRGKITTTMCGVVSSDDCIIFYKDKRSSIFPFLTSQVHSHRHLPSCHS